MAKQWIVVGVAMILWLVFLVDVRLGLPAAAVAFLVFIVLILWSSIRRRQKGWVSGAIFGVLLLTLPAWVLGAAWLCGAFPF
jgi:hypothetical protein